LVVLSEKPNTTHLAAVLQLCDMRVQNFWKRLENCFDLLAKTRLNGQSNTISSDSVRSLLWLAFGILNIDDKQLPNSDMKITFDNFKLILKNFIDCVEENGRELLTN